MDPKNAVEIRNVTKWFKIEKKTDRIPIIGKFKSGKEESIVLDNISLNIRKGDVLGIVGRNGCGKSTLLKIIARIMDPNSGTVEISGRIASILELGMGFHPDMSGRENIYLKGELYGFGRREIDAKLNDIIEYSGIGKYIDNPVRTYSSGMTGRLAFSIMVNVDADVLLVDEILSVGDVTFAAKAKEHFKRLAKSGRTVIFVSHNVNAIEQMCNRAIWLEEGVVLRDGPAKKVVAEYQREMSESLELVSELAKEGNADAQYTLGMMYKDGSKTGLDVRAHMEWIKKAADQGHTLAQVEYADVLYRKGGEEDKSNAIALYNSAAKKGNNDARLRIATLACGDSRNDTRLELLKIFRSLAERGTAFDEFRYADLISKTARTPSDRERAFEEYLKAANHGHAEAMFLVATMFRDGNGTSRNPDSCVEYLTRAGNMGHLRSIILLADMYDTGKLIKMDESIAFSWYLKAAILGDAKSQFQVATMYQDGIGTDVNPIEAERWFSAFYHSGMSNFLVWAADSMRYVHVDSNFDSGEMYAKAAELGNIHAMTTLGKMFMDGNGTSPDLEKAKAYLERAAVPWGHQRTALADYYYRGLGGENGYPLAAELYKSTAANGDATSMYRLAIMYRDGKGVGPDRDMYVRFLRSAASRGNRDAMALANSERIKFRT